MKKVAVIILNWNGEELLRKFLPSVVANTNADLADVIVADNGSVDGSVDFIKAAFPGVRCLQFSENLGFAEGYNRALAETGYEYTVLLNSDVETPSGWLEPLFEYIQINSECAACQPKILSFDNRNSFEYAGAAGGFIDSNGYPYCRGRIFGTIELDNGQYDTAPLRVFWASGAAMMVRTAIYNKVGGMDKTFFAHMEEIDLCWRLQLKGYYVAIVPQSCVYHLGGGSLPSSSPRKTYLNFRNNLLMMHKNLPLKGLSRALFVRRLLDTAAWGLFVIKGQWRNAHAIIKAHNDFRKMRKSYAEHPEQNLLKGRPNIIVDYFLRGKRFFSA